MKKSLAILLAMLMLVSLAACGGAQEDNSSAPSVDTVEKIDAIEAGTVSFQPDEEVFEEGTTVTAEKVTAGEVYQRAQTAVAPVAEKFTVYEFNAVKDEAKVQPNGTLAVTFKIPEDYSDNVKILYVADDGTTEEITATVNAGERTIVAELTHFSTYVLIDLGTDATTTTTTTTEQSTTATEAAETTTTTNSTTTTSKPPYTTTTVKPTTVIRTTTSTTTTTATTTTTTEAFAAFNEYNWVFRKVDGNTCFSYSVSFEGGEPSYGESMASPYEEMVPPEYRDEEEPSFEFNGIQWYIGAGDGDTLTSVTETGKTVTIVDSSGDTLVLERTGNETAKVVSNTTFIAVSAGDVFTATK